MSKSNSMKQISQIVFSLIAVVLCILCTSNAFASDSDSFIDISKIEILADGNRVLSTSSDSGHIKLDPGVSLRISVRLENEFDSDEDIDINDVKVSAYLDGLDSNEDFDSKTVDVRSGRYKIVTLRLEIPDDASSYENYFLNINAKGTDSDRNNHEDSAELDLEIRRDSYDIEITEFSVTDVTCDGIANVHLEIENTGEEDEPNAELEILGSGIGVLRSDEIYLEGRGETFDDHYTLSLRDRQGQTALSQVLYARVTYNNGRKTTEKTAYLQPGRCNNNQPSNNADFNKQNYDNYDNRYYNNEYNTDSQGYRTKLEGNKRTLVMTEEYTNPNRDWSFLYGDQNQNVELILPSGIQQKITLVPAKEKSETTNIIILLLANTVIILTIIILLRKQKKRKKDVNIEYPDFY